MRYKPGLKQSESSQFKFRNISVYAEPKNETLVFPDCHRDETDLMTLKYMVYKGLSMDVKEKFNLYWFKEECLPLPLLNNDDFDNFWEDSFVNEDGCICLWMGMKDTVFGTPKTTPKKKTVSKGTTPRRSPRLNSVDKSVEGASRKLSFMDVPMSKHSQASSSGCSQSKATNEVKFVEDVDNIQLENTKEDECHPIENPEAPPVYDSDEDIEYGSDEEEQEEKEEEEEEEEGEKKGKEKGKDVDERPAYMDDFDDDFGQYMKGEHDVDLFPEEEVFTPVDPSKMEVKTRFANKEAFKKHLRGYCVLNKCQYILDRSAPSRIKAECRFKTEHDCPWFVYASKKEGEKTFVLRKVNLEHKCEGDPQNRNRSADPHFVKDFVLDQMKNKPKKVVPDPYKIKEDFLAEKRVNIPYQCAWKARNLVLESLYGNYKESYNEVPAFCKMFTKCNDGSVAKFTFDTVNNTFESMTLSFEPAMRGWRKACRGVIGLDACHLTGEYGGVLMVATALDGQNGLVMLGIMHLKDAILAHPVKVSFISDRQKGLLEAVGIVFPGHHHRYCWRHLYKNFKKDYKGLELYSSLWNAAKAYKEKHFQEHFDNIVKQSAAAGAYLSREDPATWSRAFFNPIHCCEHMNNNFSESFNNMINKMRNKPIIMIGIMYANLVMGTWYNRRTESASWVDGNLVPTAVTLIKKMLEFVTDYGVDPCVAGELYMVTSPKNSVFTVNILAKTCSCLQWQLRGFPCMHAVSALHSIRPQWRKYCSDYYSVENYKATYAPTFAPLDDKSEWVQPNMNKKILNPPHSRKPGRPKSKRVRSYDEPRVEKTKRRCGKCGNVTNHNKRTCAGGEVGSNPTAKRQRTECDAQSFTFSIIEPSQTTGVRGAAKSNKKKRTASFVGECFTGPGSQPLATPSSTPASTTPMSLPSIAPSSTPPSTINNLYQNFFGIGSVSQNIKQGKGRGNGKAKKK
ncbi:hypothetical protein C5167_034097 [Papaver somniferum]|uniref:SWIM-type domain-containing protein n=3 Tax=Papaver somniferum TaxID=3469 RepID=A0A4Y7KDM4_PAPSO|nr:hypothetical protein C5167_034097 [Papaver somniferum]